MNIWENSLWKKVGYWHQGEESYLDEKVGKAVKKRTFDYLILWSVSLYKTVKMKIPYIILACCKEGKELDCPQRQMQPVPSTSTGELPL